MGSMLGSEKNDSYCPDLNDLVRDDQHLFIDHSVVGEREREKERVTDINDPIEQKFRYMECRIFLILFV